MINISGVTNVFGEDIVCKGVIDVNYYNNKQAYVLWQMFDEKNNRIAFVGRNYFIDDNKVSIDELIPMVIHKIENYRVGRKKIFKDIKIVDQSPDV